MSNQKVNIHTHRPTGQGIELRTAGIHPWDAAQYDVQELQPLLPHVQALGEIGLDFACGVHRQAQFNLLHEQLVMAVAHRLPVVLHCVRAFEPLMDILAEYDLRAVIFHGFIGSPEQTHRALERGYYLSFGERTFRSPKTLRALCETPLDRLFCETDESDATIDDIYTQTADTKGISLEELTQGIRENYKRIFEEHE